jgi:hypothetical protein
MVHFNKGGKKMSKLVIYSDFDGCPSIFNKDATLEELVTPEYYRRTKPDMSYITMLRILIQKGYDVKILSKVLSQDIATAKAAFLKDYGIDVPFISVPYDEDKARYVNNQDINILIDDFTRGLKDWEQFGNNYVGIKYYNGINGTKGTWSGYSIDGRMSAKKMANTIIALAALMTSDIAVA